MNDKTDSLSLYQVNFSTEKYPNATMQVFATSSEHAKQLLVNTKAVVSQVILLQGPLVSE